MLLRGGVEEKREVAPAVLKVGTEEAVSLGFGKPKLKEGAVLGGEEKAAAAAMVEVVEVAAPLSCSDPKTVCS